MFGPVAIFVVFTVLASLGAYLIGRHAKGPRVGLIAAGVTCLFFLGLGWALLKLIEEGLR